MIVIGVVLWLLLWGCAAPHPPCPDLAEAVHQVHTIQDQRDRADVLRVLALADAACEVRDRR